MVLMPLLYLEQKKVPVINQELEIKKTPKTKKLETYKNLVLESQKLNQSNISSKAAKWSQQLLLLCIKVGLVHHNIDVGLLSKT